MGVVLGILVFIACWFVPPVLIWRWSDQESKNVALWICVALAVPPLLAIAGHFVERGVARVLGVSEAELLVGGLGPLSILTSLGPMVVGWIAYAMFKRRNPKTS
jgi:hypothetical protein